MSNRTAGSAPSGAEGVTLASPRTLRLQIAEALRNAILSGALAPGSQLHEAGLASRLGVSRGPLREAMRQLGEEGLVANEPYRGTFVATLSVRDLEEIYSFRTVLERFAFERVWERRTEGFHRAMRERYRHLRTVTDAGDASGAVAAALDLHGLVYEWADHELLATSWRTLRGRLQMYFSVHQQAHHRNGPAPEGDAEYVRLAQEDDLAAMLGEIEVHMQRGLERVRSFLEGDRP